MSAFLRPSLLALALSLPVLGGSTLGCSASDAPADDGSDPGSEDALTLQQRSTGPGEAAGSIFIPTAPTALQKGRPGLVRAIVIHDIEGSAGSAVNTFSKAGNESSSHYVVDKDGNVIQMVKERDIANHAFHSVFNAYAIGIEHEGFIKQTYPDALYRGSAKLVAELVKRYRIPMDRAHIIGHYQVPKTDEQVQACPPNATTCGGQGGHVDPGPNWNWDGYMAMVKDAAKAIGYDNSQALGDDGYPLQAIKPLETLPLSLESGGKPPLIGGFWATQCQADNPAMERSFRSIIDAKGARLETRYTQKTGNDCGEKKDGLYPLVWNGYTATELAPVCTRVNGVVYRTSSVIGTCASAVPACLDTATVCKAAGDDCVRVAAYPVTGADAAKCR